jgi:hypothetical protein
VLAGPEGLTAVASEGRFRPGFERSGSQIYFITQSATGSGSLWVTDDAVRGSQLVLALPGEGYGATLHATRKGVPLLSVRHADRSQQFYLVQGGSLVSIGESIDTYSVRSVGLAGDRLLFRGPDSDPWVLNLTTSTGVDPWAEMLLHSLSVYPNPATRQVTIDAPEEAELEVFDLLGRRIATWNGAKGAGEAMLDVSAWPVGVYAVRMSVRGGSLVSILSVVRYERA